MDRDRIAGGGGEEVHITPGGMAGGYAPAAPAPLFFTIDRVRWGAVWAGTLVSFGIFLILSAFGAGLGLYGTVGAPSASASTWPFIWTIIALFFGGWVASRLAAAPTTASGVWHGTLVWALTLTLAFLIVGLGTGFASIALMSRGPVATPMPGAPGLFSTVGWAMFVGLIIAWLFAIAGGALGKIAPRTTAGETRAAA